MYQDSFYPFYMDFQSPAFWEEERRLRRESQLMQSFYPKTARLIQQKTEEVCAQMDYPGSFLYDEYPDRWMLGQLCKKIRKEVTGPEEEKEDGQKDLLDELICVLLFQEMRLRRGRYRKTGRW